MSRLKQVAVKNSVIVVMLALIIMFSFMSPYFLTVKNIANIISQNTYFIIAAVGLAFVMIGGGMDLSVGYQMSMVGVVTAMLMTVYSWPVWAAVLAGLALGVAMGTLNGLLAMRLRVFPLILTLAMSTVYQGLAYQITQAKTYRTFPAVFRALATQKLLGIHLDVYLALSVVLVAAFVFRKTYLGRYIMAVGSSAEASRLSGIPVNLIRVLVYSICGFLFAVATLDMIAMSNTTSASFGPGTEFTCMTAAIIGGVSFKGGKGNMLGLVVGVFVLQILGNGMQLAGWGTYLQYIVQGCILILAIGIDSIQLKPQTKRAEAKNQTLLKEGTQA